jgi:hypothetical protein
MQTRIKLAAEKGCDGIDPDNVDAFGDEIKPGGGLNLTRQDSIDYIKKMSAEAHIHGLAMGLKNAEAILQSVSNVVEFAVNEQCATYYGGCSAYSSFLRSGKPVFHIEYGTPVKINGTENAIRAESDSLINMATDKLIRLYCLEESLGNGRGLSPSIGKQFSTVIKEMDLNAWVVYCDSPLSRAPVINQTAACAPSNQTGQNTPTPTPAAPESSGRPKSWSGFAGLAGLEALFMPKNQEKPQTEVPCQVPKGAEKPKLIPINGPAASNALTGPNGAAQARVQKL